ncbi:MAG: ribosome maturation factor RimP [Tissierellia bacterium]|nr:ribosome maturation factor RimP [Tissierellia bacterium]
MDRKELRKSLIQIAEDILNRFNSELVELEINRQKEDMHIVFYVYKESGVSIDDCVDISRAIESVIDERDLIENNYFLEVSSPGLDRPIKSDDDLRRNMNNDIEIKLYAPIDGKKLYEGKINSYDKQSIEFTIEGEKKIIPRNKIALMRQVIKF